MSAAAVFGNTDGEAACASKCRRKFSHVNGSSPVVDVTELPGFAAVVANVALAAVLSLFAARSFAWVFGTMVFCGAEGGTASAGGTDASGCHATGHTLADDESVDGCLLWIT